MTDNGWRPGDHVELKSGGSTMSVNLLTRDNGVISVICHWFTDDGILQTGLFDPAELERGTSDG